MTEEQRAKRRAYMMVWRRTPAGIAKAQRDEERRRNNPQRSREQSKQYYYNDVDGQRERFHRYYLNNREARLAYHAQLRATEPLKYQARYYVMNALRSGQLIRPAVCSQCSMESKLHAHHHNGYAPEFRLDVIWLCGRCHREAHKH